MCRFLLVRAKEKMDPQGLLSSFASVCEKSRAPDGDWQGDGWGVAWREEGSWSLRKSLSPIWQDTPVFSEIPATDLLVAHARSAGFPDQKGILEYNQPYVHDSTCFVFNGMIRGVRLPMKLDGRIGAQKIFSFLRQQLEKRDGAEALQLLDRLVLSHSRELVGMNVGLVTGDTFNLLCEYARNDSYFGLNYFQDKSVTVVCSEKLPAFQWKTMAKGQVLTL